MAATRDALLSRGALILAAGILLIVMIQGWLGYWLTRHLRRLTQASERVACGQYDAHLDAAGSGEVARLAAAMNAMTAAIREKIRHLEHSEEQLRLAMGAGSVVSWLRDLASGELHWGEGAADLLGPLAPAQTAYPDLADMVVAEDAQRLRAILEAPPAAGVVQSFSVRVRRPDGAERWLAIRGKRVNTGAADRPCLIGVVRDVTADKVFEAKILSLNEELESRVRERTADLEAAVGELEAFSYSISHDLRAPLRHISGFTAIVIKANEDKLDPASREYLQKIAAGARRMAELIDDLLQLSRVSRRELRRQPFDLAALAAHVMQNLLSHGGGRRVETVIEPDMPVEADHGLLQIALENLLGNALKFTARAGAARIEVGRTEMDGETVYFVRDNGAGFDMHYVNKLFRPFERLHSKDEFEGTGIGLSIVSRIFARHGGRVWANAEVGRGAVFYFTLGSGMAARGNALPATRSDRLLAADG